MQDWANGSAAADPAPLALVEALRAELEAELRPQIEAQIRERLEREYRSTIEEHIWTNVQSLGQGGAAVYAADAQAAEPPLLAETLDVFADEAAEHLREIEAALARLASRPPDSASARAIRRSVHTLKGAAAVVGLHQVSRLAHQIEDVLDRALAADEDLAESLVALVADACGALDDLIQPSPEARPTAAALADLHRRLTAACSTGTGESATEDRAQPSDALQDLADRHAWSAEDGLIATPPSPFTAATFDPSMFPVELVPDP
ncbi:MAG: Hpt domain-containing protein, partial [Chloroflexi bacterium]|nr:Hpt domain-containing protein [Chloroflexota bacterium]